jgi:hypothetical protein
MIAATRCKEAAVRRFADRAIRKPGIPEGIPRTATIKPSGERLGWRLCIKSNGLLGPRRPVAELAATLRAYPAHFRSTTDASCRKTSVHDVVL